MTEPTANGAVSQDADGFDEIFDADRYFSKPHGVTIKGRHWKIPRVLDGDDMIALARMERRLGRSFEKATAFKYPDEPKGKDGKPAPDDVWEKWDAKVGKLQAEQAKLIEAATREHRDFAVTLLRKWNGDAPEDLLAQYALDDLAAIYQAFTGNVKATSELMNALEAGLTVEDLEKLREGLEQKPEGEQVPLDEPSDSGSSQSEKSSGLGRSGGAESSGPSFSSTAPSSTGVSSASS